MSILVQVKGLYISKFDSVNFGRGVLSITLIITIPEPPEPLAVELLNAAFAPPPPPVPGPPLPPNPA